MSCITARFAAPPEMVASFNKSSQPVKTTDRVPEWTPGGAEFMVGDQVRHSISLDIELSRPNYTYRLS